MKTAAFIGCHYEMGLIDLLWGELNDTAKLIAGDLAVDKVPTLIQ
ncbi:MAG: hypothetical protein ACPGUC_07960 [Gammaproteobacteria bacterium]